MSDIEKIKDILIKAMKEAEIINSINSTEGVNRNQSFKGKQRCVIFPIETLPTTTLIFRFFSIEDNLTNSSFYRP